LTLSFGITSTSVLPSRLRRVGSRRDGADRPVHPLQIAEMNRLPRALLICGEVEEAAKLNFSGERLLSQIGAMS